MKTKTLMSYLTVEQNFDKLMVRLEKEADYLNGLWIVLDERDAKSQKYAGVELLRKKKQIIFSMAGTPICIAAYAGNISLVKFLIQKGYHNDLRESNDEERNDQLKYLIEPQINCTMIKETEKTYSEYNECFHDITPISFTLPSGNLECFKLLMESGQTCDFRNKVNFKLLAFCQNRSFWEYLVNNKILDHSILLLAAEYAYHYRNVETASWLLKHYGLVEDYFI